MSTVIILSGTLCGDDLWEEITGRLTQSEARAVDDIAHVDLTGGESIAVIAERIGEVCARYDNPWVIGYSLGGVIALEVMRCYQHVCAGLILVCAKANGRNRQKDEALRHEAIYLQEYGLAKVFDDILLPAYFGDDIEKYHHLALRVKQSGLAMGLEALLQQRRTFQSRIDQYPYLHTITVPTLVICGARDVLCTPSQSRDIADRLPAGALVEYPDVGHALPWVCAQRLADDVLRFIRQHS